MGETLVVEALKTYYPTVAGEVKAVDEVSFKLEKGSSLGIVGESGCGKSTLGYSLLKLLPTPGRIVAGRIYVNGVEITEMPEDKVRKIRWEVISMVFQGAMNSLNPVYNVRRQMVDTIRAHRPELPEADGLMLAKKALELVKLPEEVLRRYPHELSGGMKQRVVIATALMLEPQILIADEPTTALDVVVQAQIINLLKELQRKLNMTVILLTHDLGIIPELSDWVATMYAGKIVEYGRLETVYLRPQHPYTFLLLKSIPTLTGKPKLDHISGAPPDLLSPPKGCRFHPRCPYAIEKCRSEEPRLTYRFEGHYTLCHRADEGLW